jgi:hypothetical protein
MVVANVANDNDAKKTSLVVHFKDLDGFRRAYLRFYDEDGVVLYTKKYIDRTTSINTDPDRTVYTECNGYMLDVGRYNHYEHVVEWLGGLGGGISEEIERRLNESLSNHSQLVNTEHAAILGRIAEAEAHNAPILKAQELLRQRADAEELTRNAAERRAAIVEAEAKILNNQTVGGASLILQLFEEHGVYILPRTQRWATRHLREIFYVDDLKCWNYRYVGNDSKNDTFFNYLQKLAPAITAVDAAIQNQNTPSPRDKADTG